MLKKEEILKEIQKQIRNRKIIEKIPSIKLASKKIVEESEEIIQSIYGTEQREAIFMNDNPEELYNQYRQEIESTSDLIFPERNFR